MTNQVRIIFPVKKLYNFYFSEGCAEECALDTENILGDTCSGWELSLNKLKLFLVGI